LHWFRGWWNAPILSDIILRECRLCPAWSQEYLSEDDFRVVSIEESYSIAILYSWIGWVGATEGICRLRFGTSLRMIDRCSKLASLVIRKEESGQTLVQERHYFTG